MPLLPVGGIQTLCVVLARSRLSAAAVANASRAARENHHPQPLAATRPVPGKTPSQGVLLSKVPGERPNLNNGHRERPSASWMPARHGKGCAGKTRVTGEDQSVTPL